MQQFQDIIGKELQALKINNSLLPLPKSFDTRAVQVASHVPNKEGTYRRSQVTHQYNPTDADGIEIIIKNKDEFSSSPNKKNEIFLTSKRNEIIYYDIDKDEQNNTNFRQMLTERRVNQYLVYKKEGEFFIRDLDNINNSFEDDIKLEVIKQKQVNQIEQSKIMTIEEFKDLLAQPDDILLKNISLYVKYINRKNVEQELLLGVAQQQEDRIINKINTTV